MIEMKYKKQPLIEYPVPQRHNTVVKANTLIQKSRYSLSTQEQKILLYIISQIEPQDEDFKLYNFEITEFCKVCGIEPQGDMYSFLKAKIKNIADISFYVTLPNGKDTLVRWIQKPYFDEHSGTVQIKLDEDMKPFLLQLKEKFTEYSLIYTLNFKCKYSIRLYEYLKSIHFDKSKPYTITMPVHEFEQILDSNLKDFKGFHVRALKPAHQEINQYSDLNFEYELTRKGRKTTDITITITLKDIVKRLQTMAQNDRILDNRERDEQ